MVFDIVIVGAGSIGSSAAYHIAKEHPKLTVALIGPGEPLKKDASRDTYGCHYDEGRITRVSAEYETEQVLALRSTKQYPQLEEETGIKIYEEVGFLSFGDSQGNDGNRVALEEMLRVTDEFCSANSIPTVKLTSKQELQARFPYMNSEGDDLKGRFIKENSGYISIRNLVNACQQASRNRGVIRIEEIVTSVKKHGEIYTVLTEDGLNVPCRKVILTCGSYTNFRDLFPGSEKELDMKLYSHVVMKCELEQEEVQRLVGCPSFVAYTPSRYDFYLYGLPPITYPNGRTYLKVGHTVKPEFPHAQTFTELAKVRDWYCRKEDPTMEAYLMDRFRALFPDVKILSTELDFCVMAMTVTGRQYLGFVDKNVFLAAGGNGKSAKMALELGRICAQCSVNGKWDYDLSPDTFRIMYKD